MVNSMRVLEKTNDGWNCSLCGERIRGWKDAELHAQIAHGVPREHIATRSDNGDVMDTRRIDLDVLRKAGAL